MRACGGMHNVMSWSFLLYGSEIWVLNGEMLKVLEGFHHRASRQITGMTEKYGAGGEWYHPTVVE